MDENLTPFTSVDDIMDNYKKKHPIKSRFSFLYHLYYQIINFPRDIYRKCRRGIQRAYNGWSDEDLWGFENYLSSVIYDGLRKLYITKHGCPLVIKAKNIDKVDWDKNEKVWNEILLKIIHSFKLASQIGKGEREFYLQKLTPEYAKELKCLTEQEDKEMKEGFKLFIKYFFYLYD